jgi:hypothetical protein
MAMCPIIRQHASEAAERVGWAAAKTGRPMPAAELLIVCSSFDPVRPPSPYDP